MTFQLHKQLESDCVTIGRFTLSRLLLMNDNQFPWLILVPEVADITEIYQLTKQQQGVLIEESSYLAEQLRMIFNADKINIAAIGNLVPQLHIHHVARYRSDKAWPAPVWGKFSAVAYTGQELVETIRKLKDNLIIDNL